MLINANRKIIGLSGVAGAGKDLFYEILSQKIPCFKASLADNLKKEVSPWCLENYGIDPMNCNRKEKNSIRDLLVFHGSFRRHQTQGRYWIESLEKSIFNSDIPRLNKHIIITDIRYDEYEKDEVQWLKNEQKGILVHLSRMDNNIEIKPANLEESKNNPKLIEKADFHIEWPTIKGSHSYVLEKTSEHVDKFIKWLHDNADRH
jgi:hypothetical protein